VIYFGMSIIKCTTLYTVLSREISRIYEPKTNPTIYRGGEWYSAIRALARCTPFFIMCSLLVSVEFCAGLKPLIVLGDLFSTINGGVSQLLTIVKPGLK
jgi:hypothetical protein